VENGESRLIYEIMQELGKYGAVYRCNSGSVPLDNGKRFNGMPKGFSDVMLILPGGRAAFIEIKTPSGIVSPEQERFLQKMRDMGAMAGVARSVDEALKICDLERMKTDGENKEISA